MKLARRLLRASHCAHAWVQVVDIFLRVLTAISQDVVERDETRYRTLLASSAAALAADSCGCCSASTEQKRNNQIKDAMRAKALPGIIDALYKYAALHRASTRTHACHRRLIVACQSSQPAIAREVLSTLTDYIGALRLSCSSC